MMAMRALEDIGREAAAAADRIGAGFSTWADKMPSRWEVDRLLADAVAETRTGPDRAGSLRRLAALVVFAVGLETWDERHEETK